MLELGYSLIRMESVNWGNFNGHQETVFRPSENAGPLLAAPPASAILGVNGSGKSTLIDAIMIALLPFEGSLKLGVTNDFETGSAGGRTVRDYVLGKYASTGGETQKDLSLVYNRESGCSLLLLTFQHNSHPGSYITLGSIWWYHDRQIQDRLLFVTQNDLRLQDLCPQKILPKNGKIFKEVLTKTHHSAQYFDTAQGYFSVVSALFGGISKDDLKILNRAFYVKSITNIDSFVRENMLLEQENKNLGLLLENVARGQSISMNIEKCEEKLQHTGRILEALQRLLSLETKKKNLHEQLDLLNLYRTWKPIHEAEELVQRNQHQILELDHRRPAVEEAVNQKQAALMGLQAQAAGSNTALALKLLEEKIRQGEARTQSLVLKEKDFIETMKITGVRQSRKNDPGETVQRVSAKVEELKKSSADYFQQSEQLAERQGLLNQEVLGLRQELSHLSQHRTLIAGPLYDIKVTALKELRLPENHVSFVGELLNIPADCDEFRLAIESALEPIARNLLVHPDSLDKFTRWLNDRKVKSNITVKRMSAAELEGEVELETSQENGILSMLEIKSAEETPFGSYLCQWLNSQFNYRVVDVEVFKKSSGSLVTRNGLVKRDKTTMRKLKQDFRFALGWNPESRIEELTAMLAEKNAEYGQLKAQVEALRGLILQTQDQVNRLSPYMNPEALEFFHLDETREQVAHLHLQRDELEKKDQDFRLLKQKILQAQEELLASQAEKNTLDTRFSLLRAEVEKAEKALPYLREAFNTAPYRERCLQRMQNSLELLIEKLHEIHKKFSLSFETKISQLDQESGSLEEKIREVLGEAVRHLSRYSEREWDPNLSYKLDSLEKVPALFAQWSAHQERLEKTELANLKQEWREFFNDILIRSIKDTLNEIKSQALEIEENISSINEVLKLNNFETLPTQETFLQIENVSSSDERIVKFKRQAQQLEKILSSPQMRIQLEELSSELMKPLREFVEYLQNDVRERDFVTDVRNHFQFKVTSRIRNATLQDTEVAETFSGARHDAKSSAQTTQLAYTLLASSLAYRFRFNDPVMGKNTPRLIVLDEFGGKFDNERPKDIIKMLGNMGFQSILVSPMSKGDLLADSLSHVTFVHKASASKSKVQSFEVRSREDYNRILSLMSKQEKVLPSC